MRTIISSLKRSLLPVLAGGGVAVASLAWFSWSQVAPGPSAVAPPAASALESIRADEIREKVAYLASDALMGRGNGTAELDLAAEYIAEVFRESGLEPGGDNGYFQEFTVDRLSIGSGNSLEVAGRALSLEVRRDYIPMPGTVDGEVTGPLVFAGYGVRAPEWGYDDLEGLDLNGRIAVVLEGSPRPGDPDSPFAGLRSANPSDPGAKAEAAEAAGARALILVQGPLGGATTPVSYYAGMLVAGQSPRRTVMELSPGVGDARIPVVVVSRAASLRLVPDLEMLQRAIDESLEPVSADLGADISLAVHLDREPYVARNVVGIVRGTDPALADEAIVVGAHYDHDGAEGGQIWNGADDNASGTSGLLELAEAFALGPAPARSVVLAAWAAEEKGMLGSRSYVRSPPFPIGDTVTMFQIDMIGRNEEHRADPAQGFLLERASENENALNLIGSVFSDDLRQTVEALNAGVGLDLRFRYDYRAENLIRRSDHWTFLSRRVPALFFFGGLHPDYHTPQDTAEKINYPKVEKVARLVYLALHEIGNRPEAPRFADPVDRVN